jgi:hypothetical protein
MNRLLAGIAALPFMLSVASAGQPLTAQQMDRVTAGFSAISIAGATGLAGESGVVFTATSTGAEVQQMSPATHATILVNCNCGSDTPISSEGTSVLMGSLSTASSATVTGSITVTPVSITLPPCGC